MKKCERGCGFKAEPGMKFCKVCLPKIKRELRESGYLTNIPKNSSRPAEAQEDRRETRYGVDD